MNNRPPTRGHYFMCKAQSTNVGDHQECEARAAAEDPLFTEIPSHQFDSSEPLPDQLAYPFWYQPHPVAKWAADQLRQQLEELTPLMQHDFGLPNNTNINSNPDAVGKMFGVLVVQQPNNNKLGYLKAFSGTLRDAVPPPGFCPMVYDRSGDQDFYKQGEAELNAINREVEQLEQSTERAQRQAHLKAIEEDAKQQLADVRQHEKSEKNSRKRQREKLRKKRLSLQEYAVLEEELLQQGAKIQRDGKALKAQLAQQVAEAQAAVDEIENKLQELKLARKTKSANLQNRLFEQYQFWNHKGDTQSLLDIFAHTPLQRPPAGAGDCAAPKLFQYAFQKGYKPIALAEFWWGQSPALEVRKHNFYYPACRGKCEPILEHMLEGLNVQGNPMLEPPIIQQSSSNSNTSNDMDILYEDEYMVVVMKPYGMLSVPGRFREHSVYTEMKQRYPNATGPLLVHRLDMDTSGILLVAKDKDTHKKIQAQFIDRSIKKRYTALLDGELVTSQESQKQKGRIDLPLSLDYLNRPMQKVDYTKEGRPAVTLYEIVNVQEDGRTRIHFFPVTGRTHQLRVHAAHAKGLNIPIVGDDIYGQRDERLCLHAGFLEMTHPVTEKRMTFVAEDPF